MASPRRTPPPSPLRLVQDGDPHAHDWEQLPLPSQRVVLVAPVSFGWAAAGAVLAVLLGGGVARRRRQCSARGPWVCCARHRRQYRETFGCRDCRADLLSWRQVRQRSAPRPRKSSRPRSAGTRPLSRRALRVLGQEMIDLADAYAARPRELAGCEAAGYVVRGAGPAVPCPWASCRHSLLVEVDEETGILKENFPGKDFGETAGETCSLQVALRGATLGDRRGSGNTVAQTAAHLNLVEESARKILKRAFMKYARGMGATTSGAVGGDDEDDDNGDADDPPG